MKNKVLYLVDTLEVGGAEKSLLEILRGFHQTTPLVCSIYQGESLKAAYEKSGIQVISLSLKAKYSYFQALQKVLKLIKVQKPQLIHTTLARSHFIGRTAGKLTGIPVVSSLVSDSYSDSRFRQLSFSRKIKLKVTRVVDCITARWAFQFIANSESVKISSCKNLKIKQNEISVIYRGRDPALFMNHDPETTRILRHSLQLPDDARVILNVGRLVPSKAQKNLIQAMSTLIPEYPVRLLIAGEGPFRSELDHLINELKLNGVVTLLGNRNDVSDLLHVAEAFVFPSSYEGFPGALVEAMFASRPIVASDISVHKEMIDHEQTGLLSASNPEAIAKNIEWILENSQAACRMGERARDAALRQFDIRRVRIQYEQLYNDILERVERRAPVKKIEPL